MVLFVQVLVDGPGNDDAGQKVARDNTAVHRQVIAVKRLSLTDIVVPKLPRNARKINILSAWKVSLTFPNNQSPFCMLLLMIPVVSLSFFLTHRTLMSMPSGRPPPGPRRSPSRRDAPTRPTSTDLRLCSPRSRELPLLQRRLLSCPLKLKLLVSLLYDTSILDDISS